MVRINSNARSIAGSNWLFRRTGNRDGDVKSNASMGLVVDNLLVAQREVICRIHIIYTGKQSYMVGWERLEITQFAKPDKSHLGYYIHNKPY